MFNIIQYFNSFTNLIFGVNNNFFYLMTPTNCFNYLSTFASSSSFEQFIVSLFGQPALIFSLIVWVWFVWLTIHLLLIWPFNWIRSIIRKCRLS